MLKKVLLITIALMLALVGLLFTMEKNKFYTVRVEDTVDAPIEEVWRVLADDFHKIHDYSRAVQNVEILSEVQAGLGCVRKCTLQDGGFMKEEIAVWEQNQRIQIVIKDSSIPMVPGTNVLFELEKNGEAVKITATGEYRLKYLGPFSPFIAKKKYKELLAHLIQIVRDAT